MLRRLGSAIVLAVREDRRESRNETHLAFAFPCIPSDCIFVFDMADKQKVVVLGAGGECLHSSTPSSIQGRSYPHLTPFDISRRLPSESRATLS
jgi:hypothetical protein